MSGSRKRPAKRSQQPSASSGRPAGSGQPAGSGGSSRSRRSAQAGAHPKAPPPATPKAGPPATPKAGLPGPAPARTLRAGHVAGGLLVLAGVAGLSHAGQAAATPPPPAATSTAVATTASRSGIVVSDAYVTPTGPTDALAYFTVANRGSRTDSLTGLAADEVAHDATLFLGGEEITTGTLTVGPGSQEKLTPGGPHVRLGLHDRLVPGQRITLNLTFSNAGDIAVRALVR